MSKILVDHTPGGIPVYSCECGAEWLPLLNRMGVKLGIVKNKFDIWQGGYRNGATRASAGTHDGGGVFDFAQHDDATLRLMRMAGSANWYRPTISGENHGVLVDCIHHPSADYQVDAYRAGYDGLGYLGRMNRYPYWRPSPIPSWRQGVVWMKLQLGDDLTVADISQLRKDIATTQVKVDKCFQALGRIQVTLAEMNTVENPLTHKSWRLNRAVWSLWTYVLQNNAMLKKIGK